jgi:hypothetical protein
VRSAVIDCQIDGDTTERLLERRWFASMKAVRALQAECELLSNAWQCARSQLAILEAMHEALSEELAQRDPSAHASLPPRRTASSAA